jgi:dTMP kinase
MTKIKYFGYPLPGHKKKELPGKLIVLEGTDGVGRSTQIALLREWLESRGYAVSATGLKRGKLAGKSIQMAMEGHTLGDATLNLSYATDFADRLEREIIPSLRAGFVVLLDRYIYSIIARAQVRSADPSWIRNVLGFAIVPDVVFYLQADLNHLVPRVLNARGFSYWESGMDTLKGRDYYDSYIEYQTQLIAQFDAMSEEFGFVRVDANSSILEVFQTLRAEIKQVIKGMKPAKKVQKKDLKGKPAKEKKKPAKETKSRSSNGGSKADGDRSNGDPAVKPSKPSNVVAKGVAPPGES